MSRIGKQPTNNRKCFPRVSGDEPNQCLCLGSGVTFSPRERG